MTAEAIERLGTRLSEAQGALARARKYHDGRLPTGLLPSEIKTARPVLFPVIPAWASLIVSAVEQRLDVSGFRVGEDAVDDLWDFWQSNSLDEASQLVHQSALIHGRAYVSVWADADGQPTIRPESPTQMITDRDPATGAVRVALKIWTDQAEQRGYATVYGPDVITRWQTKSKVPDGPAPLSASAWTQRSDPIENPLGLTPVVAFANRPSLDDLDGRPEFDEVISLIDASAKLATDLLTSSEFASMPRRWMTGVDLPVDDDGNELATFSQIAGRVWLSESPESKFGQFPEADLSGYIAALDQISRQIASLTSTPPAYLGLQRDQPASADAIRAAEAGLVQKVRRRQRIFGGGWEDAMRLAMLVRDGHHGLDRLETVWRDPETPTVAQAADAALKKADIGIPFAQLAEDLGYSPQQIEAMRASRRAETLDSLGIDLGAIS